MKLADRPGSRAPFPERWTGKGLRPQLPGLLDGFTWNYSVQCPRRGCRSAVASGCRNRPHFWSRSGEKTSECKAGPPAGNQIVDIEAVGVLTGQERPWARPLLPSPFFRFLPKPKNAGARPAYRGVCGQPAMDGRRPAVAAGRGDGRGSTSLCAGRAARAPTRSFSARQCTRGAGALESAEVCGSDSIGASARRRPDAAPGPCHAPRNAIIAPQAPISNVSCAGAAAPAVAGAIQTARTSR